MLAKIRSSHDRSDLFWGAMVVILALVSYANIFPGQFILDDHRIVETNPLFTDFNLWQLLRSDYWGPQENSGLWRPLTSLTLYLNLLLGGAEPWSFRFVNLLLHASVSLLLFALLKRLDVSKGAAWFAAVLFAVHPLHTEVVNMAVGRGELLAALFMVAALITSTWAGNRAAVLTVLLFVLALLSKEHAVMLLVLLPLLEGFRAGFLESFAKRWPVYAGLLLSTVAWMAWRTWGVVLRATEPEVLDPVYAPLAYVSGMERFLTALKLQLLYVGKFFWPWPLQAYYSGPDFPGVVFPASLSGLLLLLGWLLISLLIIFGWLQRSSSALWLSLYLLSFLPASNLVFAAGVTFAERLSYFPSVWLCALVAMVAHSLSSRLSVRLAVGTAGMVLITLLAITMVRNSDFRNELGLWQTEVRRNPQNVLAWQTLAEILAGFGRTIEAEEAFRQMFALEPDSSVGWHIWSRFLLGSGKPQDAVEAAQKSLAGKLERNDPRAPIVMGTLVEGSVQTGAYVAALDWLDRGASFEEGEIKRLSWRVWVLARLDKCSDALQTYETIPPVERVPAVDLAAGRCLLKTGQLEESVRLLQKVVAGTGSDEAAAVLSEARKTLAALVDAGIPMERKR